MQSRLSSEPESDSDVPYIRNGGRREYKEWFKAQVVEECREPGSSVSIVARRHNINSNVLFRWRREYRLGIIRQSLRPNGSEPFISAGMIGTDGKLVPQASPRRVIAGPAKAKKPPAVKNLPAPVPALAGAKPRPGVVELHLSGHVKMIRIQGDVTNDALQNVLAVARELS
ncbi:MAG: transposase [Rhodomicrobium sp.]